MKPRLAAANRGLAARAIAAGRLNVSGCLTIHPLPVGDTGKGTIPAAAQAGAASVKAAIMPSPPWSLSLSHHFCFVGQMASCRSELVTPGAVRGLVRRGVRLGYRP